MVSPGCERAIFEQIFNKGAKIEIGLPNVRSIWDTNTHARLLIFYTSYNNSPERFQEYTQPYRRFACLSDAPVAIEALRSGAKKGQDCSFCKTALFSLHIGGWVVAVCIYMCYTCTTCQWCILVQSRKMTNISLVAQRTMLAGWSSAYNNPVRNCVDDIATWESNVRKQDVR